MLDLQGPKLRIGRFEGGSRLGTWLHRIVVNASLMKLRTRRRKPEEPLDPLLPRFLDDGHLEHPAQTWAVASDEAATIVAEAAAAGVPAAAVGRTGGGALTVSGDHPISLGELRAAHEGWLPAYMADG